MLLDTSGVLAIVDRAEPPHEAALEALMAAPGPLVLSPLILAEVDYLVGRRAGHDQRRKVLRHLHEGPYVIADLTDELLGRALLIDEHHSELDLGIVDASIIALAEQRNDREVLTLDERNFRAVVTDPPLRILPADL